VAALGDGFALLTPQAGQETLLLPCPADARCGLAWQLLLAGAGDEPALALAWGVTLPFRGAGDTSDDAADDQESSSDEEAEEAYLGPPGEGLGEDELNEGATVVPLRGGPRGAWACDAPLLAWTGRGAEVRFVLSDGDAEAAPEELSSTFEAPEEAVQPPPPSPAPLPPPHVYERSLAMVAETQAEELGALAAMLRARLARLDQLGQEDAIADAAAADEAAAAAALEAARAPALEAARAPALAAEQLPPPRALSPTRRAGTVRQRAAERTGHAVHMASLLPSEPREGPLPAAGEEEEEVRRSPAPVAEGLAAELARVIERRDAALAALRDGRECSGVV